MVTSKLKDKTNTIKDVDTLNSTIIFPLGVDNSVKTRENLDESEYESSLDWDTNIPKEVYIEPICLRDRSIGSGEDDADSVMELDQLKENSIIQQYIPSLLRNKGKMNVKGRTIITLHCKLENLGFLTRNIGKLGSLVDNIEVVYVNIPYDFNENGSETLIRPNLKMGNKFKPNVCPDFGIFTNILGILHLEMNPDTTIIAIKDLETFSGEIGGHAVTDNVIVCKRDYFTNDIIAKMKSCDRYTDLCQVIAVNGIEISAPIAKECDKVAVIVEPRVDPLLPEVLESYSKILGEEWKIQIFHGTENGHLISDKYVKCRMNIINFTREDYSKLLLTSEFYKLCLGQYILIFQLDSCINSKAEYSIDYFLGFDYVGAPWINQKSLINNKPLVIGNGGLSLRKKSKMIEICDLVHSKYRKLLNKNEDVVISSMLQLDGKLPDMQIGKKFSVELQWESRPFGVHRAWDYLNNKEFKLLLNDCPELMMLKSKYFPALSDIP
jgi:hypothetical protein